MFTHGAPYRTLKAQTASTVKETPTLSIKLQIPNKNSYTEKI